MKKRPLTAVSSLLLTAVLLCAGASAFDANDYDYGGGYSYDYDDDDDYDYGGSSWYDDDDDDNYSGSSVGRKLRPDETLVTAVGLVVSLILAVIFVTKPWRPSRKQQPRRKQVNVPNRNTEVRSAVKQFDPSFSSEEMLTFAKNTFIAVQDAWCAKDLGPVRGIMHTNLYNTTLRQVQAKIDQHVTYHYENYTFRNVYLTSYVRDREYEYITVYLNAEYIDYQTDDNTGSIIRGDKTTMWKMRYLMKFMRSVERRPDQPKYCPNCGAPLDIASSGKCGYCGSTVTSGSFDWLLSDFTTVRNDTKDNGIRI